MQPLSSLPISQQMLDRLVGTCHRASQEGRRHAAYSVVGWPRHGEVVAAVFEGFGGWAWSARPYRWRLPAGVKAVHGTDVDSRYPENRVERGPDDADVFMRYRLEDGTHWLVIATVNLSALEVQATRIVRVEPAPHECSFFESNDGA